MSGPGGRGGRKNTSKGAAAKISDRRNEILRRIHASRTVSEQDLRWFFHLDRSPCHGCRGNNKENPLCLCGITPPPSGNRKTGLWQKLTDILQELGPDPYREVRALDIPAGLTNLGATCYVNSVLQCLFMNTTFRDGVFAAEMELVRNDPVLHQLVQLFAQLHSGRKSSVDSAMFASTLELDNAVQQDGQEFLKLLLTLLERVLAHSRVPEAREVVQNLFRGAFSHVTKCSSCGKESSGSEQSVDFYEIELNVKGLSSLDESLDDYLSEEQLSGDNQYSCDYCKARVDATRSTKLRLLPPVLNFQLKRFVFNLKTATKKKVTSKFSFPKVLDMESRVSPLASGGGAGDAVYDLTAILMHKGNTASSGHYIAHIKDDRSGQWWQFDDEEVTTLGAHPLGEPSSKLDKASPERDENLLMSPDAYMLMFSRRTKDQDQKPADEMEVVKSIPEYLKSEIEEQNESFMSSCEVYKLMRDEEEQRIVARRAEVKEVLANARPTAGEGSWISAEFLRDWSDNVKPPSTIDNSSLLCEHGRVSFKNIPLMKCISTAAWDVLYSKYGGEPVLPMQSCCLDCIYADAGAATTAENFRSTRAAMKIMAEEVMAGKAVLEGQLFYVSKPWLAQWMRKKGLDAPGDADLNPTSAITCAHGALLPDDATSAKRQIVPEMLWSYFYQNALLVGGDDQRGFPIDTETCKVCEAEHTRTLSRKNNLRATKMEQRQKQEAVFSGRNPILVPGEAYYLVPSSWISLWRAYIGASGRNVLDIEEPVGLENFLASLLCKHGGLLYNPPILTRSRRGEAIQKSSSDDVYIIVSHDDWVYFCQQWDANSEKGIRAYIEESPASTAAPHQAEAAEPVLKTEPEVCRECIDDRETIELVHKLNYTDATITVDLVQGKDPPPSLVLAPNHQDAMRRTSKRARRTVATGNKQVRLTVSGTTTVYQLKLLIWEMLGVVKENQVVHFGKVELADESTTLADVGVLPNSQLWVSDSGLHEHRDIADELSAPQQHVEEGFRGTRLLDSCLPGPANGLGSSGSRFLEPGIC